MSLGNVVNTNAVIYILTEIFLSLMVDIASAAFIEALPVMEFVAQLLGKDVLSRSLSDSDRVKVRAQFMCQGLESVLHLIHVNMMTHNFIQVKKALRGVKVEVTHRGNVRRKYRVSGITTQPTRELV